MNLDSFIVRGASLGVLLLAFAVPQCGVAGDSSVVSPAPTETAAAAAPPAEHARPLPARIRTPGAPR